MHQKTGSLCVYPALNGATLCHLFYVLKTGVRQGGVLSSFLFSVFIDDLVKLVNKDNIGCRIGTRCTAIFFCTQMILFC